MLIFLLLVAMPIVEIALFIQVGGWLGLWPTVAIVILTAAIGTVLLRAQGLAALGELQRQLGAGEDPSATLAHGAMILVAGVLLLTPGFFTDGVGFLLLLPPVRAAAIRFAVLHARSRMMPVHLSVRAGAVRSRARDGPGDTTRGRRPRRGGRPRRPACGRAASGPTAGARGWARTRRPSDRWRRRPAPA